MGGISVSWNFAEPFEVMPHLAWALSLAGPGSVGFHSFTICRWPRPRAQTPHASTWELPSSGLGTWGNRGRGSWGSVVQEEQILSFQHQIRLRARFAFKYFLFTHSLARWLFDARCEEGASSAARVPHGRAGPPPRSHSAPRPPAPPCLTELRRSSMPCCLADSTK